MMQDYLRITSVFIIVFLLISIYSSLFYIQIVRAVSKIIIVPDEYPTIQAAIDVAEPKDVVYVRGGTYLEHVIINKPLWLIGEGANRTVIDGQQSGATITIKASNVLIKGFTITGGGTVGGLLGQGIGIALYNVANCTIINNRMISNRMSVYLHSSSKIIIYNNAIVNNREGIHIYNSSHNEIIKNDIVANKYFAINLFSSNNTRIIENNIMNNSLSISLRASSNNNTIIGNNIVRSGDVILSGSSHNNISKNIFIDDGLYVLSSYENIIKDNIVNGEPLVYFERISNSIVKNAGQVILINCKNITIRDLELTHTGIGIELWQTNNTIITKSNLRDNQIGIYLYASSCDNISENTIMNNVLGLRLISSSYNSISGNNFIKNGYGMAFEYSLYNNIYQNNIISSINYGILALESLGNLIYNNEFENNSEQVLSYESINIWDNDYPFGGNYWSNYIGTDLYSGICQNETGSDGIGDTPYSIDNDNIDRYPLMKKFKNMTTIMETSTTIRLTNYNNVLIGIIAIMLGFVLFLFNIYIRKKIRRRSTQFLYLAISCLYGFLIEFKNFSLFHILVR